MKKKQSIRLVFAYLLFCFNACFGTLELKAQMSTADSTFLNTIATESLWISYWNYPGHWYIRPELSSVNELYLQCQQEFPFSTNEFAQAYPQIITDTILLNDTLVNQSIDSLALNTPINLFGINEPFRVLPFSLNGKKGYARALLDSSHNNGQHQVAYMVILGTGTNIIKQFYDNLGYHNTNCATMDFLKTRGDVYVMTTPNEEMRAIYFNKKKMRTSTGPSFLLNYLNADNRAFGITRLIEYLAMIKYLKSRYERVIVLGLSTGGKVAHWVSLMAEPDAALVSSGYSILVDNDFNSQNTNALLYGPYQSIFTKDSLRNKLKLIPTQFLFTLPQNDAPIAQIDIDSNYTKNFYQDVNNASFFYNYTNHAFPPCANMDTFFNRCLNKPKVKINPDTNTCLRDSLIVQLHFIGQAPFDANLMHNDTLLFNFHVSNYDTSITLYNGGDYWIDQIDDAGLYPGYRSDTFHYIPTPPINAYWESTPYNCDSNKQLFNLHIEGIAPFYVEQFVDGQIKTWVQDSIKQFWRNNGIFQNTKIHDNAHCQLELNDSVHLNYSVIAISLNTPVYDCDSNKRRIQFQCQGNAPWMLLYSKNGQWIQDTLYQATNTRYYENGLYQLTSLTDAQGCSTNINQLFNFNDQTLNWTLSQPQFNCDSNQVNFPIQLQGNPPWNIHYRNLTNGLIFTKQSPTSNITLELKTGLYVIESVNDATCNSISNDTIQVNFPAIQVQINTPSVLCDSGKMAIDIDFQNGLAPAYLYWIYNGLPDSILLQNGSQSILMPKGTYFMQHIRDSANCLQQINSTYNANYIPLAWHGISHNYNCQKDSSDIDIHYNGGQQTGMYYTRNNIADTLYLTSSIHQTQWPRGNYHIVYLRDTADCIFTVDTQFVIRDVPVSLSTKNIEPNCLLNEYTLNFKLEGSSPWELSYIYNNQIVKNSLTDSNSFLNIPSGAYTLYEIKDQNGCIRSLHENYSLPEFLIDTIKIVRIGSELVVETSQHPIQWEWNGQMLDSSFNNQYSIPILGEGLYRALITDSALCLHWTNAMLIEFDNGVSLYPNPTSGLTYLAFSGNTAKPHELVIYNMHGEKIKSWRSVSLHHKIDMLEYPNGLYYLKIIEDGINKPQIIKIIKK